MAKKKESTAGGFSLENVRLAKDGDLRAALLAGKPDEIFLIGEHEGVVNIDANNMPKLGETLPRNVELVWVKVFRTKG